MNSGNLIKMMCHILWMIYKNSWGFPYDFQRNAGKNGNLPKNREYYVLESEYRW